MTAEESRTRTIIGRLINTKAVGFKGASADPRADCTLQRSALIKPGSQEEDTSFNKPADGFLSTVP